MSFFEFFGNAKYIRPDNGEQFPYIRKSFWLNKPVKSAKLYLSVLGFGEIYLNDNKLTDDLYITPYSQYNKQSRSGINIYSYNDSVFNDELSYRIYVSEFDVSPFINTGKNAFGIIVAGGWYRSEEDKYRSFRNYGDTKVCFRIVVEYADGDKTEILSDNTAKWERSFLLKSGIYHEEQDETKEIKNFSDVDFNDKTWRNVTEVEMPDSEYCKNDCPPNRIIRYVTPKFIGFSRFGKIFDVGENVTGYPIITSSGKAGEVIICLQGETLDKNGELDLCHCYEQKSAFYTDGRKEHFIRFTWHGFRYFELINDSEKNLNCTKVAVVNTDVKNTSAFKTDSDIVNWIYNAYIRTQSENYQCGVPTDCPQIERKGYTGDGQVLAESGMTMFDAKALYKKWIRDISDCQDKNTGFVHYSAPCFIGCSGGPGGWSSAIVNVPYFYYHFYADKKVLETYYGQMAKYVEFIKSETDDNGLIKLQKRNCRCLGDWAAPVDRLLPAEFVNGCLFVDSLLKLSEIAHIIGDDKGAKAWENLVKQYKIALENNFYDFENGDFCNNEQGANAFALSIGLGDNRTEERLVSRYRNLKRFDTGIFGTKILVETLLRLGEADVVYDLWDSDAEGSFKSWKKAGATTFWEAWTNPRSLNHPMFGAFTKCFFEYILGVRRKKAGFSEIEIRPLRFEKIDYASGKIITEAGEISVSFTRRENDTRFEIIIPDGIKSSFFFGQKKRELVSGNNSFVI